MTRSLHSLLSAALVAVVTVTYAPVALACGGFFCSATPVDQTGERIIFAVDEEAGTIQAIVQIAYEGPRHEFAWVVPVPGVPELDTFPQLGINALDASTATLVDLSPECNPPLVLVNGGGGFSASTVRVLSTETVGPYDTAVIAGTRVADLVDWLNDNGFLITDEMEPLIEPYARDGQSFLALKLNPESDVGDIEPLVMTYQSHAPMIPLKLTAVAAEPEMRVTTWILAKERWAPANYADLEIDNADISLSGPNHDYYSVVSREVDAAGGHAFVTEYAGPTEDLASTLAAQGTFTPEAEEGQAAILELLAGYPYVTRLFSRISPEEMTLDPYFEKSEKSEDVSNIRDLTDRTCEPQDCFDYNCGPRGVCEERTIEGNGEGIQLQSFARGCLCEPGTTARGVRHVPSGSPQVFCEPVENGLLDEGLSDACDDFDCGNGECFALNGNPTCICEEGELAQGAQSCVNGRTQMRTYCGDALPRDWVWNCPVVASEPPPIEGAGGDAGMDPSTEEGQSDDPPRRSRESSGGCSWKGPSGTPWRLGLLVFGGLLTVSFRRRAWAIGRI